MSDDTPKILDNETGECRELTPEELELALKFSSIEIRDGMYYVPSVDQYFNDPDDAIDALIGS